MTTIFQQVIISLSVLTQHLPSPRLISQHLPNTRPSITSIVISLAIIDIALIACLARICPHWAIYACAAIFVTAISAMAYLCTTLDNCEVTQDGQKEREKMEQDKDENERESRGQDRDENKRESMGQHRSKQQKRARHDQRTMFWYKGVIKFFSYAKNYGFIKSGYFGEDVYFWDSERHPGLSHPIQSKKKVLFRSRVNSKGRQAFEVRDFSRDVILSQPKPPKINKRNIELEGQERTHNTHTVCSRPLHGLSCIRDTCLVQNGTRTFLNIKEFNFFLHMHECELNGDVQHTDVCEFVHCDCT